MQDFKELVALTDQHKQFILDAEAYIWKHPEVGYKEWQTSKYLEGEFEKLGYTVKRAGDIPGFSAVFDTGKPGPTIGILGELDSLICANHPDADPQTQQVHACGHHVQAANLLGCAAVFKAAQCMEQLCGKIHLIAVPAEETIDLAFREELVQKGIIKYVAGKVEFLYRGFFDEVDLCLMVHAGANDTLFAVGAGGNGCITKHFEFEGIAAHAGEEPYKGINALYAATLGLQACNALRETFQEKDYVRVHPIITQAGVAANAIPNVAKLDAYVRAANFEKMIEVNQKVNRAFSASAAAMGANLLIQDKPGNLPLHNNRRLIALSRQVVEELFGSNQLADEPWKGGCTDLGDISALMPVIHLYGSGATGTLHGDDFKITDKEKACLNPVKYLTSMVFSLLSNNGAEANEILQDFQGTFGSKAEYFKAIDQVAMNKRTVCYQEDGSVLLNYMG